ncbi:low affinity iron permease family protein [Luteibacter sp.]|uniref:low affinity iron permease family protein n=1 Tax=Luteibacter sp. TaxID=1886636 RepID=UPI003F817F11
MTKASLFNRLTTWAASAAGSPTASIGAAALVAVWAACGPAFHYSETWQLVINTGTTIVTFLMVFLIQSSQNRDACAVHLKLDEIISALKHANDELMDLEGLDQATLDKLRKTYVRKAAQARSNAPEDHAAVPPADAADPAASA